MRALKRVAAASVLTGFIALATRANAGAQALPPPSPAPSPTPAPAPAKAKLFAQGPQFISVGIAIAPRVETEFRPGSTAAPDGFSAWQAGETTLLGRFDVASYTDFRAFGYDHFTRDPVATIGGGGSAVVPGFRVHLGELESGGGVRVASHVYAGLGLLGIATNTGYPTLSGVGYVLMLEPSASAIVTPYARAMYAPNVGGNYALNDGSHTALTYRSLRYHAGVLIREPGTRLGLDVGYAGEHLTGRTNAPAPIEDSMLTMGLDVRF